MKYVKSRPDCSRCPLRFHCPIAAMLGDDAATMRAWRGFEAMLEADPEVLHGVGQGEVSDDASEAIAEMLLDALLLLSGYQPQEIGYELVFAGAVDLRMEEVFGGGRVHRGTPVWPLGVVQG